MTVSAKARSTIGGAAHTGIRFREEGLDICVNGKTRRCTAQSSTKHKDPDTVRSAFASLYSRQHAPQCPPPTHLVPSFVLPAAHCTQQPETQLGVKNMGENTIFSLKHPQLGSGLFGPKSGQRMAQYCAIKISFCFAFYWSYWMATTDRSRLGRLDPNLPL